jgi:hypothetical protein
MLLTSGVRLLAGQAIGTSKNEALIPDSMEMFVVQID